MSSIVFSVPDDGADPFQTAFAEDYPGTKAGQSETRDERQCVIYMSRTNSTEDENGKAKTQDGAATPVKCDFQEPIQWGTATGGTTGTARHTNPSLTTAHETFADTVPLDVIAPVTVPAAEFDLVVALHLIHANSAQVFPAQRITFLQAPILPPLASFRGTWDRQ